MKLGAAQLYFVVILLNVRSTICRSNYIVTGYEVTLAVPAEYGEGFIGRAFLIQTELLTPPNFRAALTVEATQGNFSCSLQVFLGEVKVWSSGHFSRFFTPDKCVLQLTPDGDLRLKGPTGHVGWRTGTSGQGVEKVRMLRNGNLALVDNSEGIKWQSFNFPTDVMVLGQSLNVATVLTSFPPNSTSFYTFEIHTQKLSLYLNTPKSSSKYSYWEFTPPNNLSFITLNTHGLDIFNHKATKIATIPSPTPLRFLALGNATGNLGLYSYSPQKGVFEASFRAVKTTCDLPLACKAYGICTVSKSCSCIRFEAEDCEEMRRRRSGEFCGGSVVDEMMIELEGGISSVLRDGMKRVNVSKEECGGWCLEDCKCVAAMYYYGERECYLYRVVMGVREMEMGMGMGLSYMIKVRRAGTELESQKRSFNKWVIALVTVVDVLVILAVSAGLAYYYYFIINNRRRNNNFIHRDTNT